MFIYCFIIRLGKVSEVSPTVSSEDQTENDYKLEEMENFLYGDNGIMKQLNNKLMEESYVFRTLIAAYSKEDIQMEIILSNREATESVQEKVKSIFYELVEKNNLNSSAFTLKVSDYDNRPDW